MKIFSWNCRGLGNPRTVNSLREWCWRERPNIVFLMETMIDSRELERVRNRCGFDKGMCFSSAGLSGGIGFWWNNINVRICSYSTHHVEAEIYDDHDVAVWRAVGIYGWPEATNKHHTWQLMRTLCKRSPVPIVMFGDFNEIVSINVKEGGAIRGERQMDGFHMAIDDGGFHDLGYKGNKFTWQRGNSMDTLVRERLDRFLAQQAWCALFSFTEVIHYPIYKSDHAPILLKFAAQRPREMTGRIFRFESLWLSNDSCEQVVTEAWRDSGGQTV